METDIGRKKIVRGEVKEIEEDLSRGGEEMAM